MESAGCWPMAIHTLRPLGVSLSWYPSLGVTGGRYPPLAGCMLHSGTARARPDVPRTARGELSGGKWIACRPRRALLRAATRWVLCAPLSELLCLGPPGLAATLVTAFKIVTWLILPVVICLSQRLSHACLSISNIYRETANGSLNQLSFI